MVPQRMCRQPDKWDSDDIVDNSCYNLNYNGILYYIPR